MCLKDCKEWRRGQFNEYEDLFTGILSSENNYVDWVARIHKDFEQVLHIKVQGSWIM